jgi:hypothetical protein
VDSAAVPLVATPTFWEQAPAISRDGRWLAYSSNETGRHEIFVRPFPDVSGGKWQVSSGGGINPVWVPDGADLRIGRLGCIAHPRSGFLRGSEAAGAELRAPDPDEHHRHPLRSSAGVCVKAPIPWLRVLIEGVVIVGSILVAFGIDAWWQDRAERQAERDALAGLLRHFAA